MSNAEKIRDWCEAHPDEMIATAALKGILGLSSLRGADLRDANLWGAQGGFLTVVGLPSGGALLVPTPDGWVLRVGCWMGTVAGLEALIATDEDWPEAEGEECDRRRPALEALITLCHAHMNTHPGLIDELRAAWAHRDTTTKGEDE